MKNLAVLAIVLSAGAVANAQMLNYGSTGVLVGMQANTQLFPLAGSGTITGFMISADMLPAGSGGSWQSDMMLTITSPDNVVFNVGGYTNELYPWNDPTLGGTGTFPAGNGGAGSFAASYPVNLGNVAGTWTVELKNDWEYTGAGNSLEWNNVTITLVPAPGSLALLGVAGMIGFRRRR